MGRALTWMDSSTVERHVDAAFAKSAFAVHVFLHVHLRLKCRASLILSMCHDFT